MGGQKKIIENPTKKICEEKREQNLEIESRQRLDGALGYTGCMPRVRFTDSDSFFKQKKKTTFWVVLIIKPATIYLPGQSPAKYFRCMRA